MVNKHFMPAFMACLGGLIAACESSGAGGPADGSPTSFDGAIGDAGIVGPDGDGRDAQAGDAGGPSGSSDAGPDAAREAGSLACPGLFCEDFETGQLDRQVWTRIETDQEPSNSVRVQSEVAAEGRFAAHFHARGGSDRALMFAENLPSALRTHFFGRMLVRISDFPRDDGGHTAYVTAGDSLANFPYRDHHLEVGHYYAEDGPVWQLTYWTGDGPEYIGSGGHIPKDKWFCLEWEFNDQPNQIAVWVDGKSDPDGAAFRDINGGESGLLGSLGVLGVGFRTFHPEGAPDVDMYVDALVLDTKRVSCP